jgi:hypothetical protein
MRLKNRQTKYVERANHDDERSNEKNIKIKGQMISFCPFN